MIVADRLRVINDSAELKPFFPYGNRRARNNIERAAQKAGPTPKEQATTWLDIIDDDFRFGPGCRPWWLHIFMRTSEAFPYQGVSEFWRRAAKQTPKATMLLKGHTRAGLCPCRAYKTETSMPNKVCREPPTCWSMKLRRSHFRRELLLSSI